jgi:Zn-dependent protease
LVLAVLLFLTSLFSATVLGGIWSMLVRTDLVTDLEPFLSWHTLTRVFGDPALLRAGLQFALASHFILLCHELGHWFACRHHRLDATYPFFLPSPIGLGTFGAFIRIRSAISRKRELLDVGVSGPLAGFVALLPILVLGVAWSQPAALADAPAVGEPLLLYRPGHSLLLEGLTRLFHGPLPPGIVLNPHPLLLAGWLGLFATMLNLLPLAQLDGGHILYAAIGKWQRKLAWPMWGGLLLLGLLWPGWWVWCGFVLLLGVRHPRIFEEEVPLDRRGRRLVGAAWLVFAIGFMPEPIAVVELPARSPAEVTGDVARREVEHQGDRTVVDQLDRHRGAEAAALDAHAQLAQPLGQALDDRGRVLGARRAGERRPASALGRSEQRELRDQQDGAARVGQAEVHLPLGILEDAQAGELRRRRGDLGIAVAARDADQRQ